MELYVLQSVGYVPADLTKKKIGNNFDEILEDESNLWGSPATRRRVVKLPKSTSNESQHLMAI